MQVPEQVVVDRDAHPDEPFAVIDQQPDVELNSGQLSDWQALQTFAKRGPRDRDRVDAIRLAAIAAAAALAGSQPCRDADHALAMDEQKPLKGPRDVTAILKRPDPLATQSHVPNPTPRQSRASPTSTVCSPASSPVAAATAAIVCDRLCMSAPSHDHQPRSLSPRPKADTPADMACWGRCHAPIKSRRDVPDRRRATQRKQVRPRRPTAFKASQLAARSGTSLPASDITDDRITTASLPALARRTRLGRCWIPQH